MPASIRISNIVYLKKTVKDYAKPFRFTLTLRWTDGNDEHGVDIVGCLGGVGRDGVPEWRGPMFWIGKKPSYTATFEPGTYEKVLKALTEGGYFKWRLADVLPPEKPVPAEEEYGLPGSLEVL